MRFTTFLTKNLLRRKMRSLLTCVGIAVAVGTTVALLGISSGFESSMARSFSNKGTHIVVTDEGMLNQLNSEIDQSVGARLRKVPGVGEVGEGLLDFIQYETPRGAAPLFVQGWPLDGYVYREVKMLEGDGLIPGRSRQVVVGAKVAKNLELKLGDSLNILGEDFEITGIFQSASFFDNSGVVIEIREFQRLWAREGVVTGFSIIVDKDNPSQQYIKEVCERINNLREVIRFRARLADASPAAVAAVTDGAVLSFQFDTFSSEGFVHRDAESEDGVFTVELLSPAPLDVGESVSLLDAGVLVASAEVLEVVEDRKMRLSASPTEEYAQGAVHIQMAQAMAWMTSAIAIIVGSIGMLNTMVMSVVERIREISILRAIGWRKSRIVRMILGESMMLSFVGACLGALAAVLLTKWLTTLPAVNGFIEGKISPMSIVIGFALAAMVGLVGGLYPAYRATQLLPSEGLRHE